MPEPILSLVRSLVRTVYLPWGAAFLGAAMLLPVLPVYLKDQGLSFTMVSVVLAAAAAGSTLGDLPASVAIARFGTGRVLVVAAVVMSVSLLLLGLVNAVLGLLVVQLAYGAGASGILLSRQTLVREAVSPRARGRVMSLVGGTHRLSLFVGPVIGGLLADSFGYRFTFAACGAVTLLGCAPAFVGAAGRKAGRGLGPIGLFPAIRRHRLLLARAGVGPLLVHGARTGRTVVIPLIGQSLGLSATEIGTLVAVGTGADLLLFPVSGWVMDRYGRLFAIVPAFSLMAAGLIGLGFVNSTTGAVVAGMVIGIGNGLSAGTMLTLMTDLAPDDAPSQFFAAMSVMQGLGGVSATLVVGGLADVVDLGASSIALGIALFSGVLAIVVLIGETNPQSRGATP